jgi:hypothetical protein
MTSSFDIRTTPRFDRLVHALHKRHTELAERYASAICILSADPYNRGRQHNVRKLEGVRHGEGQYRLSLGRWRFRYDIYGNVVVFFFCGLRREDTYR